MRTFELKERKLGLYKEEPHYNSSEFTVSAQHFKEFGSYTRHPVNTSTNSQWYKFWVEEARRSLYGYNIGRDWIPGYYYWYLNYSPIEKAVKIEDVGKESLYILPESSLNYSLSEKDNSEFSIEVPDKDQYLSFQADRVTAFPDFWDSDYDFFHYTEESEQAGEHAEVVKTRGRGYSFKGSSMLDRNFYLIPRSKSYAFAAEKEYLISDGILTKAWDMMGHIEDNTPWGKRKAKVDTMLHKRASYLKTTGGVQTERGFGSEIIGVTFKNNPDKGRGKRGKLIIWEELGMFMDSLISWNIMLKSMSQGRMTYGLSLGFGTGGSDSQYMMGLEQLFTRGKGYKVHMIPNKIEPSLGYDSTAFFVGEQCNHEAAMDKDGNSNTEKALEFIIEDRKRHLEQTKNREMHARYCAEAPIKPSEAFMQVGGNRFPTELLKQQRAYIISHKESMMDSGYIGTLYPDSETGKIQWKIDLNAIPIDHYPHNDVSNLNGCVVIYEPPITNREGKVPDGLYISGNDNYDHDESTTDSLGSTFVMNKMTERIVAEYTGRPDTAATFYRNNWYLLQYYNAMQNFENNLQGLRTFMRKYHSEYMLCDTPDIIKNKIEDKRVLNREKGTPGTGPIINTGLDFVNEWLIREAEPGTGILNLHNIKSIALLDELIYYNKTGNFDRVLALVYLLILHENLWEHKPEIDIRDKKVLDPFFANNPLFAKNQNSNKIIMPFSGIISPFKKDL